MARLPVSGYSRCSDCSDCSDCLDCSDCSHLCPRCQDEKLQSEQRANIKRALLTLHRRGYRIRLGRTGTGWFVFINGEDAERDDVHVVRADRLDALANAIRHSGVWP